MDFNEEVKAKVDYEFSHRFNHTLHAYIDISEDLIAGTLLSQIMYWFSKDKSGNRKVKIYKDGYYWLAKSRNDWINEIRISPKQYDNAIKKLKNKGFVETKLYKFESVPTTHIRPIYDSINKEIKKWKRAVAEEISQDIDLNLPKEEIGIYPKVKTGFTQRVKSITETTNKEKEEEYIYASCPGQSVKQASPSPLYIDKDSFTKDELHRHLVQRTKKFFPDSENNKGSVVELTKIIEYFYAKYEEELGQKHPILSDRALDNITVRYLYPSGVLDTYSVYDFDDYKDLIDRYFTVEYGKYRNDNSSYRGEITLSLSHFMSDAIRENLFKNVTGVPY